MTAAVRPEVIPASDRVARRVNRLAHGLLSLGLASDATVVVACCDSHTEDRGVALAAVSEVGAIAFVFAKRTGYDGGRPQLVLACQEGLDDWSELGIPARVVSDAPGTVWWRLLERGQPDGRVGQRGAQFQAQGQPVDQ